jgi:hypothetical protein
MMFPARIKKGTAMRTGESMPVKIRWATSTSGVSPWVIRATRGVSPKTKATGTPIIRKKKKDINRVNTSMGPGILSL